MTRLFLFGAYYTIAREVFANLLSRGDDEELIVIPVTVKQPLREGGVTFYLIIIPVEKFGAALSVLLFPVGIGKAPVDICGPVVFFHPALLELHEVFGVVAAVLLDVLFEDMFVSFFAGLGTSFYPAGTEPVHAAVRVEVLLVFVLGAEQKCNAVMAPRNNDGDFGGEANDAVAAKTVAEEGGIIGSALDVGGAVEGLLDLAAKPVGLFMEALLHKDYIDGVLRACGTKVGLFLQNLTNYELESFHRD